METQRTYIAIDLKSFYASVECMQRGLDPMTTNLVVADLSRTEKTICLAVSPALKQANAQRQRNAPGRTFTGASHDDTELKAHPELAIDYVVAPPQMAKYMKTSTEIYNVYLKYVAPEDIHVYSIDEVFIDATHYLGTYKLTPREFAMKIILDVLATTGITATAGIGTNMYLCKVAMDIVAKHIPADRNGVRIAELDEMSYRRTLWSHRPLTDFWRVGRGYARKLEAHRMFTMGDVARQSVQNDEVLYNTAALVIEAQDARHHVRAAICGLQCRGAFLLIADASGLAALACGEACGDEGLLFHTRLCLNRSGHAVQIPDFISLICRKCDGLNETVPAGGHPAVHAESSGYISGQVAVVSVEAFDVLIVRLCDEGLHLHIAGRHQRTGHTVEVDALVTLIDVVGFQFGGFAVRLGDASLNLQRPLELFGKLFPSFRGPAQDAQAGFPGQIISVRRIVLQNLRQGRFFFFSGGHPSIERRCISTPGRNQFPVRFAQQIPSARCQVEGLKHHRP